MLGKEPTTPSGVVQARSLVRVLLPLFWKWLLQNEVSVLVVVLAFGFDPFLDL